MKILTATNEYMLIAEPAENGLYRIFKPLPCGGHEFIGYCAQCIDIVKDRKPVVDSFGKRTINGERLFVGNAVHRTGVRLSELTLSYDSSVFEVVYARFSYQSRLLKPNSTEKSLLTGAYSDRFLIAHDVSIGEYDGLDVEEVSITGDVYIDALWRSAIAFAAEAGIIKASCGGENYVELEQYKRLRDNSADIF